MDEIKSIAKSPPEAILQAIKRTGVKEDDVKALLAPVKKALEETKVTKRPPKKQQKPTRLTDEQKFKERVLPAIYKGIENYENAIMNWTVNVNDLNVNFKEQDEATLKQTHQNIIKTEENIANNDLIIKFYRGAFYYYIYHGRDKNVRAFEIFEDIFRTPYRTVQKYITFAMLISRYPVLLVCGLSFSIILLHNKRLSLFLESEQNDDLNAKLKEAVEVRIGSRLHQIKPSDVKPPFVSFTNDNDEMDETFEEDMETDSPQCLTNSNTIGKPAPRPRKLSK